MRAQHLAQRRMQQMRAGMVAPDRIAPLSIDHGIHVVAHRQRLLQHRLVRPHPLHRQHAAVISATVVLPSVEVNQPVSPTCPPESP